MKLMKRATAAMKATFQNPQELQGLDARLAREQALIERVAAANNEYVAAHEQAAGARTQLDEARRALGEFKSRLEREEHNNGKKSEIASILRGKVDAAQAQCDALSRSIADTEQRASELNAEISRLQTIEIPVCRKGTSVAEVLAHQARVAEATEKLAKLDELIAAQEAARDAIVPEDLSQFESMLEKLHADRVLGEIDESDFQRQEAEITAKLGAARETNAQINLEAKRIWHAIDGLQVRRREAAAELAAVESKTRAVIAHLLRSEAELLGVELVQTWGQSRDLFIRAVGLHMLARDYPEAGSFLHDNWMVSFNLPSLRVDAFQGKEHPSARGLFFSAEFGRYNTLWPSAAEAEKARLQSLGVKL